MQKVISDLWNGRTPLPRAFWEYAICYGTLLNLVTTFASLAALSMGAAGLVALALHFMPLPYNLFAVVAVWRSAGHYRGSASWALLSRIGVIVWALIASVA
ncbi:hypothetical protein [Pseudorhodoplanes sinuspersici]|uniref:Uncharacterized protein n=1 Tax=Pseudorhodoplanes sinuspersici TaxID=1235591 RepID=A0A1W6ZXF8_9HYPH|nr:hypothetical protein [Pseudorhodoplanes sinuspersici]ARQ02010.1 hypothetical protein CAK95_25095 [Pseudorhodoplanes sinuspersici]RKE73792.1 hypothetical protein DFP91_1688 [Pseudorhodoplanes sinuspersici]